MARPMATAKRKPTQPRPSPRRRRPAARRPRSRRPSARSDARCSRASARVGDHALSRQTQSHGWVSRAACVAAVASAAVLALTACGSNGSDGAEGRRPTDLRAVDVARHAGIAAATRTHGENCVADINKDGVPDLILSKHEQYAWPLYLGRRDGTSELDDKVTFAKRDRHGCAVADFNGDGLLDIYMSIGGCKGTCTSDKELWIQQPDHTFKDEAQQWDVTDPPSRGRVPVVFDANGDGRPDLFVGSAPAVK